MKKHIEVEQKFQVSNHQALQKRLTALGAAKLGTERQVDTYYNAPHRDFLAAPKITEWLRLRDEDGNISITYKHWHSLGDRAHCDEYESSLSDGEALRKLLEALDFRELITVDKHREEWQLDDTLIALDAVKNLGNFVEFEYKGEAETSEEAHLRIEQVISKLKVRLTDRNHVGYPYLLLQKRAQSQSKN